MNLTGSWGASVGRGLPHPAARVGGWVGGREEGREGGRKGGREGGKEGGRKRAAPGHELHQNIGRRRERISSDTREGKDRIAQTAGAMNNRYTGDGRLAAPGRVEDGGTEPEHRYDGASQHARHRAPYEHPPEFGGRGPEGNRHVAPLCLGPLALCSAQLGGAVGAGRGLLGRFLRARFVTKALVGEICMAA